MYKVAVMMSTYNGEKYLKEQVNSILKQKNVEVDLFIRDDGSIDNTKEILIKLMKIGNINVHFGENYGVGNSFMELMYSVPDNYDYYALSDQDDIWKDNKLIKGINLLKKYKKSLYASNQECIDQFGNSMCIRYSDDEKIYLDPNSIVLRNKLAGCTMIFPKDFFSLLINKQNRPSKELLKNRIHDVWIAMVASIHQGIYYDNNSYMEYRQHANNVVGAYEDSWLKDLKKKIKKIYSKAERNGRSKLAREIIARFPNNGICKDKLFVCMAMQDRYSARVALINHIGFIKSYTNETSLGLATKILFGFF